MNSLVNKYAQLLVNYCLEIKEGDKLYVTSTVLAEPLVREVYREALKAGALVDTNLTFHDEYRILIENAITDKQLEHISPVYAQAMESYDAYLAIRAPFNLREDQNVSPEKAGIRQKAMKPVIKNYFERTATRDLKRNLCQFPTQAAAQEAGMSLEEYEQFVYGACRLFDEDPVASWLQVRHNQQKIVDLLNSRTKIRYKSSNIDITFSTNGRTWINSDGQTNMPSGEVYTSPEEDSVNGVVHFDYPSIYMGHEVEGVTLWVENGEVQKWEAKRGQDFLDRIFAMEGTRRFGEAAIGTNSNIDRFTKNILFDEKIGGTIHMAIGQSYLQAGGKNQSSVHWDMIADMTKDGQIFADDEKIYENGRFLFV
ncbi:MAG: aminopeptidase [Saprospiraceae bacterium]|nr:aminopeptidase [Saprospiraceae bacterium]